MKLGDRVRVKACSGYWADDAPIRRSHGRVIGIVRTGDTLDAVRVSWPKVNGTVELNHVPTHLEVSNITESSLER